jgi:hypothetical protein
MICTAKQLVKEYGMLALPNLKPGRSLDPELAYTVEKFCCNNSVSRVMLGKEDYVAVKTGGYKRT